MIFTIKVEDMYNAGMHLEDAIVEVRAMLTEGYANLEQEKRRREIANQEYMLAQSRVVSGTYTEADLEVLQRRIADAKIAAQAAEIKRAQVTEVKRATGQTSKGMAGNRVLTGDELDNLLDSLKSTTHSRINYF